METTPTRKNLFGYFVDCVTKKYAKFEGRARRSEYWGFVLFNLLISMGIGFVGGLLSSSSILLALFYTLLGLYSLFVLLPGLAVTVRRLHDLGKGGGWIFFAFVPIVGAIALLIWYCTEGERTPNRFGPDPKDYPDYVD